MRLKNPKTRCTKLKLNKCKEVVKAYDRIQLAYAQVLEGNDDVAEFYCNVPFEDDRYDKYVSDFVIKKSNGDLAVRECVWRKHLTKPKTIEQMDFSQLYWRRRGVTDWKVVVEKEKTIKEDSE